MRYHYANAKNEAVGPVEEPELHALAQAGLITADTHVLQEGTTEWIKYGALARPSTPPAITHSPPPPRAPAAQPIPQYAGKMSPIKKGLLGCTGLFVLGIIGLMFLAFIGSHGNNSTSRSSKSEAKSEAKYEATSEATSEAKSEAKPARTVQIGDKVTFNDSVWIVNKAQDLGQTLSGGALSEDKTSSGKYILVKFTVTNTTNEEEEILDTPKLFDSKGRKFNQMDDVGLYLPEGANEMTLEQLPSGLAKTFYAIFEVPGDASQFSFQTRSLGFDPNYKLVSLGF